MQTGEDFSLAIPIESQLRTQLNGHIQSRQRIIWLADEIEAHRQIGENRQRLGIEQIRLIDLSQSLLQPSELLQSKPVLMNTHGVIFFERNEGVLIGRESRFVLTLLEKLVGLSPQL